MSDNNDTTPTPGQETPPTPVTTTTIETQARIAGLDKKVTELVNEKRQYTELLADYAKKAKDAELALTAAQQRAIEFEQQIPQFQQKVQEAESRAATFEKQTQRQKLFMGDDFKDLSGLEAKGMLRVDLEGEAFTTYLNNYKAEIDALRKGTIVKAMEGSAGSGTPPRQDGTVSLETLYAQHDAAMKAFPFDKALAMSIENQIIAASEKK